MHFLFSHYDAASVTKTLLLTHLRVGTIVINSNKGEHKSPFIVIVASLGKNLDVMKLERLLALYYEAFISRAFQRFVIHQTFMRSSYIETDISHLGSSIISMFNMFIRPQSIVQESLNST